MGDESSPAAAAHPPRARFFFSSDHKVIGIQYGLTAAAFLLFGFALVVLMRWQLAYPGQPFPLLGRFVSAENPHMPEGRMTPNFYNSLGAMHGTIMVFLAVVPLLTGAFGTYLVPLQIGAPGMAFPRLTLLGYWSYVAGGLVMLGSFFLPDGPAQAGWTSYPPLADITPDGQTAWLVGMVFLIASSTLGSINMITTIVQSRTAGMSWLRMPIFVWTQLGAAFLLLLAFPPLETAAILQLSDRLLDTSFFLPSGLVVSGEPIPNTGGGSPLLWQHLFWFLAHPEVYVLLLPAVGIVTEIIANNTRRPLWGYRAAVAAVFGVCFFSFLVWAHHMFLTGMGTTINAFFEITTMAVSVPSVLLLTILVATLWGGAIRFPLPMFYALAFLPMFGIGGLTGLPLGLSISDVYLHDTFYVVGHFHYIVAPGTLMAVFGGICHWYPKSTGRQMNNTLGHLHFWPSLITLNLIFFSMLLQGLHGVSRRLYDGGVTYAHGQGTVEVLHKIMTHSAFLLGAVQVFFLINLAWSAFFGKRAERNPWAATTLEWTAPSPPVARGNFETAPVVFRGPYEYSVPGAATDFTPQAQPEGSAA